MTEEIAGTLEPHSLRHLQARLALVEDRIRQLVAHRRAGDPAPDDPFRGLYLSDEVIDQLLGEPTAPPAPDAVARAEITAAATEFTAQGRRLRLHQLSVDAELSELDVELLLIALLPDLDSRFERFYGYLNDDVTRKRATIGMGLELAGESAMSADARARLLPGGPLVDNALVLVEDNDRPLLSRGLRVPDRVTAHLLGNDVPDPVLVDVLEESHPFDSDEARRLTRGMAAGHQLAYVRERSAGIGVAVAAAAIAATGRRVLVVNFSVVRSAGQCAEVATAVGREALLRRAGVVVAPVEALVALDPDGVRRFSVHPVPVVLVGSQTWDPGWTSKVSLLLDAPVLTASDRLALWGGALSRHRTMAVESALPIHFVLGPQQVSRAVSAAQAASMLSTELRSVVATGTELGADELRQGARTQNAAGLERLARRIEPEVGWEDIVLPADSAGQLRELAARARHRDRVLIDWRMRPGGGRGRGVTALFAGDSGTGKTMSAEVIARDLGLDLYTVNLATVVDKYIGETEKNLERIFAEASGVNAVLLFDEADAIFGKRSEVRDAHDRYANIESAYLLQRMETFDWLAILSTNLRANIDEAFTRRLDMIIDFPAPDERARLAIWERCLVPPVPLAADLNLEFCARSFTLSGGNIRSAATTAGYLAAARGVPLGMAELIAAIQREYRKLGRLVLEREFGQYFSEPSSMR